MKEPEPEDMLCFNVPKGRSRREMVDELFGDHHDVSISPPCCQNVFRYTKEGMPLRDVKCKCNTKDSVYLIRYVEEEL